MSIALLNVIPAEAIEVIFDSENQPWFKRAELGRYLLGLSDIKATYRNVVARIRDSLEPRDASAAPLGGGGGGLKIRMICSYPLMVQ